MILEFLTALRWEKVSDRQTLCICGDIARVSLGTSGREGENGSEELVAVYATRAADEIKEANLILQVLAASL